MQTVLHPEDTEPQNLWQHFKEIFAGSLECAVPGATEPLQDVHAVSRSS